MLKSSVREAFETSVTCVRLPVRCQVSQVSTVPKASSPRSARARAPGTLSSSQAILVPLKYGSITRPVRSRTRLSAPISFSSAHCGAVRRSCQTMALWIGSPVCRSQTMVVSRWLVMPIAHHVLQRNFGLAQRLARDVALRGEDLLGVVLDPAGLRKDLAELALRDARPALPCSSNRIARELVVPWSRART